MPFDTDETSIQDGEPIHLYRFQIGDTPLFLTDSMQQQTDGLDTYEPSSINRGNVGFSITKAGSELQFDLSIGDVAAADLVNAFVSRPPSGLTSGAPEDWSQFGRALALSGTRLLVASPNAEDFAGDTVGRVVSIELDDSIGYRPASSALEHSHLV